MASLIAPLASGISTAASGSVEVYHEDSSTLANVFSDAHGETQVTTHTLDARGAIVRYVEGRVRVRVLTSAGAEALQFVWGTDAREARLENLGFTGPTANGQITAGGRTTVDVALSRLFASLGSTDGQVMVNGSATSLTLALSGSAGLVYNVKSAYGATGDGVANDGPEIQAAINAAEAAGGGIIYFPHGTYLCTTAVVVSASTGKLFFLGEAATGTFLKQATATTMLTLGASNQQLLMNLTFTATAANTGTLVQVSASGRATFISCTFDALNGTTLAVASGSRANLFGCTIAQAGASSRIAGGTSAYVRLVGCEVSTTGGSLTCFSDAVFVVSVGTNWNLGASGSAGTSHVLNAALGLMHLMGGEIRVGYTSGTLNLANAGTLQLVGATIVGGGGGGTWNGAAAGATLIEAGCSFSGSATIGVSATGYSLARWSTVLFTIDSATSYTPSGAIAIHEYISTGASMAFNDPSPAIPVGNEMIIVYKNGGVGNITPTFGTGYSITSVQVNAGNSQVYRFVKLTGGLQANPADMVLVNTQVTNGVTI